MWWKPNLWAVNFPLCLTSLSSAVMDQYLLTFSRFSSCLLHISSLQLSRVSSVSVCAWRSPHFLTYVISIKGKVHFDLHVKALMDLEKFTCMSLWMIISLCVFVLCILCNTPKIMFLASILSCFPPKTSLKKDNWDFVRMQLVYKFILGKSALVFSEFMLKSTFESRQNTLWFYFSGELILF